MFKAIRSAGHPALVSLVLAIAGILTIPALPYGQSYAAERRAYIQREEAMGQARPAAQLALIIEPNAPTQASALPFSAKPAPSSLWTGVQKGPR